MSIGAYKDYHLLEIGTKVYLVFSSRRAGNKEDIIMMCKIDSIHIQENKVYYTCKFIKFVIGKYEIDKQLKSFYFANYSINPETVAPALFTNIYVVFTSKEKCKDWLKYLRR